MKERRRRRGEIEREGERSGHVGRRERSREFWENGSKMGPTFKEIQLAMGCWASTLSIIRFQVNGLCPYWTLPLFLFLFLST